MVLTLGLLAGAGLTVAVAAPATAVPGLNNVVAASAANSNVFKSVVATCPAGQRVIGGGARLSVPSSSEVSITHLAPTVAATGYEAQAYEDADGFAGNWAVQVIAICANTPAGHVVVAASSPMTSPATATVTATCPAGLQVLGTGGSVGPGRGTVVLTGVVPSPVAGPASVSVTGAEVQGGFAGTWNVTAWAICAAPTPGATTVVTISASNSASPKTQFANCPTTRPVHGIGFQFGGAGVGEIFLNIAIPNPLLPVGTNVPVVASEDQSGVAGNWSVSTYAICTI